MKTYIEEIKKRTQLCKEAESNKAFDFHCRNLLDYLESIGYFEEQEKRRMICEICKNPLYTRKDGSLTCIEMHH